MKRRLQIRNNGLARAPVGPDIRIRSNRDRRRSTHGREMSVIERDEITYRSSVLCRHGFCIACRELDHNL